MADATEIKAALIELTQRRAMDWLERHPDIDDFHRQVLLYVVQKCRGREQRTAAHQIQYYAGMLMEGAGTPGYPTPVQYVRGAESDRRGMYATAVLTALREDPDGPRLPLVSSEVGWYVPATFEDMFVSIRQTRSRILRLKEKLGRLWATYKTVLEELGDLEPAPADIQGLLDYDGA